MGQTLISNQRRGNQETKALNRRVAGGRGTSRACGRQPDVHVIPCERDSPVLPVMLGRSRYGMGRQARCYAMLSSIWQNGPVQGRYVRRLDMEPAPHQQERDV